MRKCSCDGCPRPAGTNGWCGTHLYRLTKYGPDHWSVSIPGLIKVANTPELALRKFTPKYVKHESGCWHWIGSRRKPFKRYAYETGEFKYKGKDVKAHRASWILHRGEIPTGMHVLHKCHNPLCVNPDHLYLGDHADNMRDVSTSGRSPHRKLTTEQAAEIRASSDATRALARRYGVDRTSIKAVRDMRTHKPAESE